ncbi:MAG: peptidase M16 [Methylomonas sp.]|nr:MAG: peptidase M16 [Methylomonas sp.]PPD24674.1 MAG: peptidase M16 [Methylomonas sp.]PPD33223.1 MAG: peptidase M16 [Methylomonas sp.]PPD41683.1 MAG: peptidase M16 [Methylomonas sp.]PPD54537.1 MAG: peptidase M16 [Methylomonas sp.]
MRFNFIALIGLSGLIASGQVWAGPGIKHWQTQQGARVYYVNTPSLPMIDVRVIFDAGSARDGQQQGVAALTSALFDTGAGAWNADAIAERFESVGAVFSSSVSEDNAWLSLRTLSDKTMAATAIETFDAVLSKPTFGAADFEREKTRMLAGLKHREESPGAIARIAFQKALYGDHPYAHPEEGFIDTVSAIQVSDIQRFYDNHYIANNAVVVIVGDIAEDPARELAQSLVSHLKTGHKPEDIPQVTLPKQASAQHIAFPSSQTHVLVGLPGKHRKDPDYFPLYVGNHILGGGALVSRLFEEVREKRGLAYSASSQFSPMYREGPFAISLQTRNDQTKQALAVVDETLQTFIDHGPEEAELTAAKNNIIGGFALRTDTNAKLLEYVSMIGFYQQPLDYLDTFPSKVAAVTAADVQKAFKARIRQDLMQTITVGGE